MSRLPFQKLCYKLHVNESFRHCYKLNVDAYVKREKVNKYHSIPKSVSLTSQENCYSNCGIIPTWQWRCLILTLDMGIS